MDAAEQAARTAQVAATFDLVADTYDTVDVPWFTPIARATVAAVEPRAGETALDLGTGRGAALWPLAEAVGPTGRVTALDISARMVDATRRDAATRGLSWVDVRHGDVADPAVAHAAADVAVASLVLFFLRDPAAALRKWWARLVPGGRLAVSTFAPREPVWEALDGVFTPYLPAGMLDARASGTRGPFGSDEALEALVAEAGFVGVRTAHLDAAVRFRDLEHWRTWSWSHGQRRHWLAVPEGRRAAVLDAVAARVRAIQGLDGSFALHQRVRLTSARRGTQEPPVTR